MISTRALWILLATLLCLSALLLAGYHGLAPRGTDDQYYFAQARSLLVDRDLDLRNELGSYTPRPENVHTSTTAPWDAPTATGHVACKYSIGIALLELPFVGLGLLVANAFGRDAETAGGYEDPVYVAWHGGSLCFALLAVACAQCFLVRTLRVSSRAAFLAAAGALAGGPLLFHGAGDPYMAHMASAALVAALLACAAPRDEHDVVRSLGRCMALGALLGLAIATRLTNLVFALALLPVFAPSRGGALARLLAMLGGALLGFAPQMLAWNAIYGSPFAMPYGGEGFDPYNPELFENFFAMRAGLFFWAPLWALGLGAALARCRALSWLWAASLLLAYLNASWWCWWWGDTYGGRAYDALYPLVAAGLAVLLSVRRRRLRGAALAAIAVGALWTAAMIYRVEVMRPAARAAGIWFYVFASGGGRPSPASAATRDLPLVAA